MPVKHGSALDLVFYTRNASGVLQDADALPTQNVYVDNNAVPLTLVGASVTNIGTGKYIAHIVCDAASGFQNSRNYNWEWVADIDGVPTAQILASFDVGDGVSIIMPALAGTISQSYALSAQVVSLVRGDSTRLTFNLGVDRTGWDPYFAMRVKGSGRYVVPEKAASWIDATLGTGYVDLSAVENVVVGTMEAEIELRNGEQRNTAMRFSVNVIDDVVKG